MLRFCTGPHPAINSIKHQPFNLDSIELYQLICIIDLNLGNQLTCEDLPDYFNLTIDGVDYWTAPTKFYYKNNQTTNWLTLEGLSAIGKFQIDIRDYNGVGTYNSSIFFKTENASLLPVFDILEAASPDITVNVTLDDGVFIIGNYSGIAFDSNNTSRNISGDFKIKKAP